MSIQKLVRTYNSYIIIQLMLTLLGAQFGPIGGEIRLNTDGNSRPFSGRLEIYINNQWGTVCDDGFRQTEAERACRQLGLLDNLYYGNVGDLR